MKSPGLAHLQLDPKILHLQVVGAQQSFGAMLQDLPF